MRVLLGAFGDPGHAFPMLALGERLAARGHDVALHTWRKWTEDVARAGMTFYEAPEYDVFFELGRHLDPYEAGVAATRETVAQVDAFAPDACVSDVLTMAPALAAELRGVPVATFVPHIAPVSAPGVAPYGFGARPPRTPLGAAAWRRAERLVQKGLERGRADYNGARAQLGLAPRPELHGALSRELTMIGTLPQLEYPREWPGWMRVVGPVMWEPPGEPIAPPPGSGSVVLVAPSTAHDAEHHMLRACLDGLAREDVRVIATYNGRVPPWLDGYAVPANAVLVPWLSYAGTMPTCDLVISHGGHGTLMRALSNGCAVVVCPAAGDMYENAARCEWAGVGVRLPRRLLTPRTLRLAVRRALGRPALRARATELAQWCAAHDGTDAACDAIEAWVAVG